MARLQSIGFELGSLTAGVELTAANTNVTLDTTTVRSGTYAIRFHDASGSFAPFFRQTFSSSNQSSGFYTRAYVYVASAGSAARTLICYRNASNAEKISIMLNSDQTLQLRNVEDSTDIGSPSNALSLNTWYRVELFIDTTTVSSTDCEARIDGVSFASSTSQNLATGVARVAFGSSALDTSYDVYMDDIAINDTSGTNQNSWPGEGSIIHLRPNADGDNEDWTNSSGTDGWGLVNEVTPDDATTHIRDTVLSATDDFNIDTSSAIASYDIINCLQVGVRFAESATTESKAFVVRLKSTSGGTVEESSDINPSSTSYVTNAPAEPRNYPLTLYDLPGASTIAWTKADLETSQIGVRISDAGSTENIRVSTLWLVVDYKEGTPPVLPHHLGALGAGG